MKNLKSILLIAIFAFVAVSCTKNDASVLQPVASKTFKNLAAPAKGRGPFTGAFAKFNFKEGKVVTGDNWDIAFRGTELIINGGQKGKLLEDIDRTGNASLAIIRGTSFGALSTAPADSKFKQDSATALALTWGSGKGWYTYAGPPTHAINPITGNVLVIKTIDGNYVKMEIRSYYKDLNATNPANGRHYTFDYVYNPNKGDKSLK